MSKTNLHRLVKGLSKDERKMLVETLDVSDVHLSRMMNNVGNIRLNQLQIIIPFLESVYGSDTVADWNNLYYENGESLCK